MFKNKSDYSRGLLALEKFNTSEQVELEKNGEPFSSESPDEKDRLVDVLAFCFMPNHVHILLRQRSDSSISEFMRKFGAGYVGYFNRKYSRKGPLIAKFRAVHVEEDDQAMIALSYIHMNPISIIQPGWKNNGIKNATQVLEFLEKYEWSSFATYLGKRNLSAVTDSGFLSDIVGGSDKCREFVADQIEFKTI